ncbi:MAG TPA: flagellar FliJ family protein [Bacteroidales bacterium]|nr:flagellar FliJ family protein [Bacteroidales bacterium]
MKFEFSLESVLKVRKHEEQLQEQRLAEELSRKKVLNRQKIELRKKIKALIEDADQGNFENLHNLKRHRSYVQEYHKRIYQINQSLEVIENSVKTERDKLALVHKKRKIIEKVKEEEYELFLEKVSKLEQKVMDEIAGQTFSRSK